MVDDTNYFLRQPCIRQVAVSVRMRMIALLLKFEHILEDRTPLVFNLAFDHRFDRTALQLTDLAPNAQLENPHHLRVTNRESRLHETLELNRQCLERLPISLMLEVRVTAIWRVHEALGVCRVEKKMGSTRLAPSSRAAKGLWIW